MTMLHLLSAVAMSSVLMGATAGLSQEADHQEMIEHKASTGHSHLRSEAHGGQVVMTSDHHFEVVFMHDHVIVYLYDKNQKPISAQGVTGEVTFRFKDGPTRKASLTLMEAGKMMSKHGEGHGPGMLGKAHGHMTDSAMKTMHQRMGNQDHLVANIELGKAGEGQVKATFHLNGLPGGKENEATFSAKFKNAENHPGEKHEKHEHHH